MAVVIDPRHKVMLIDTSYFIFYRYFAVYNWYKLANKQAVEVDGLLQDAMFIDKFDKLFEECLLTLSKKHGVPLKNTVFVKDCSRDSIWRCQHFPEYKKCRDDRGGVFNGDIFKHCYASLIPALKAKHAIQDYEHKGAEADDIVSVFARELQGKGCQVVIITNDNDYLQLIGDNTRIFNLKHTDISQRLKGNTPEEYLAIKILMGDKSDNIPAVFPKCGEKTAAHLASDGDALLKKLSKCESYVTQFELNKLLIDMSCIPLQMQSDIRAALQVKT